jgi:hypothetical protein
MARICDELRLSASTATKPAIRAYSTRSWPFLSAQILSVRKERISPCIAPPILSRGGPNRMRERKRHIRFNSIRMRIGSIIGVDRRSEI